MEFKTNMIEIMPRGNNYYNILNKTLIVKGIYPYMITQGQDPEYNAYATTIIKIQRYEFQIYENREKIEIIFRNFGKQVIMKGLATEIDLNIQISFINSGLINMKINQYPVIKNFLDKDFFNTLDQLNIGVYSAGP